MADRGRGRGGGRGDFGGRGRGSDRGRGDGRGRGRGDFGGRGRGDFGGRGGGRGDFGGRGAGRGRGGDFAPIAPSRDVDEGTAARPGKRMSLLSAKDADEYLQGTVTNLDQDLKDAAKTLVRPKKPQPGRMGKAVQVFANHFPVKCSINEISHYDVDIKGKGRPAGESTRKPVGDKPLPTDLLRLVIKQLAQTERWERGEFAYDGRKNIYSPRKFLPQRSQYEIDVEEPGRRKPRSFVITINFVASVNVMQLMEFVRGQSASREMPQDAIQALDAALNSSAANNALCTTISRSCFFEGSGTFKISGGAEVWLGYKQSLRPCENGLTLNIDVAATAFLSPDPVLKFLSNTLRRPEEALTLDNREDLRKAEKALRSLKVNPTHSNSKRTYKVRGIKAEGGAAAAMFQNDEAGTRMSVADYFESQYKFKLRYPRHPMLNVGTPSKEILLPIEVCKLASGQRRLKLDSKQTADMIKITATKPADRSNRIQRALNQDSKLPVDETVRKFGMQVSANMALIDARVLPAPSLKYAKEFGAPSLGSWNLKQLRFQESARITSYGLASFASERMYGSPGPEGYSAFISHLMRKLQEVGLATPDPQTVPPIIYHDGRNTFPGETMEAAAKAGFQTFRVAPQIVFVLLPDNSLTNAYTEVKRASDSYLGIPSQCFAANKAKIGDFPGPGREQYLANIAMKVNAKLKGTNVVLSRNPYPWMNEPYMVFGADVTHSRSFDSSEPSVAAVVGSLNRYATRYSCRIKIQGHRQEMIQDLKSMIKDLLKSFYRSSSLKPKRLIFYRDGVSEGQFAEVQRFEITQIIAACRELGRSAGEDYSPPLTFVVAQKRHNTRFFPKGNDADRSGNVLPGLVVDTKVVHPVDFSFFLNSHAGLQGTSRPCHYHVLLDQAKMSADELQNFTNSLCYLYARCSKSVSIVIPAYYAHLAAARGKAMITHGTSSDSESTVSGQSMSRPSFAEFAEIHPNLKDVMFYV